MRGQRSAAQLAFCIAALLLVSSASGYPYRHLLADDAADPAFASDPADQPLYSLVTACPAHLQRDATLSELYKGKGFDVVDLTATIEMTQEVSFANNWREKDPTSWAPGDTRINYTVEISPHGGILPKQLTARLHTGSCFSPLDKDTVYLRHQGDAKSDVTAVLSMDPKTHMGTSTTTKNYLIDYDKTQAFVVYHDDSMVACCDMIPPFPDFPTEWRATVEANIINQGYTYVQRETYSEAHNKVRVDLHSYDSDIIMVQDYGAKKTTIIYPANSTYPQGFCQERDFIPSMANFVDDTSSQVYSTKNFLMFEGHGDGPEDLPTFDPGHVSVRGIPSEAWFRKIENKGSNSSFDVSFFFPVNEWLTAREHYHRMLKQISVVGTMNGEPVNHLYSYINNRPYIAKDGELDVCAIAPRGQNCSCEGKKAATKAEVDNVITFNDAGEGVSITKLSPAAVKANTVNTKCPANDKFTDDQKQWYGMWAAVGFAIGVVVAWLCSVCWYRTVVGVHGGDRMGHAKLRERPFIIGRQPSSYI